MILFACNCPNCISENVRFDYAYNTPQTVVRKYFFVVTVDFPSQKQKIYSWKVSDVHQYHLECHKRSN